jgi:hypothetical protein
MNIKLVADSMYAGVNLIGYTFRPQESIYTFKGLFCSIQGEENCTLQLEAEEDNLWLDVLKYSEEKGRYNKCSR